MAELGGGAGSGYPGNIDTDINQESTATTARADVPNDLAAAIIAIQTELGTNPAGSLTNVKTFLQTEHNTNGTHSDVDASTISVTGVADFADGTVSLPSITNSGDPDTGIFFSAADTVDITTGGARVASFTTTQVGVLDGSAGSPAIGNIGNTNTGLYFPAADSIATSTGGSEAHRTDSSQRTIHGHTASVAVAGIQGAIQSHSIANASSMVVARFSADAGATQLVFGKSRGALGTPGTTVVTGDDLGAISIAGDDGTDMATISSQILFECEGTIATNQIPGITRFFTANSSGSLMEWLRGDSSQNATFAGALTASGGIQTDGTNTLKTKVIDIGDWDMDATTGVDVAHGLTLANIRHISAMIRQDDDAIYWNLDRGLNVADMSQQGQVVAVASTNVSLWRLTSGVFDSTTYDSTSYNRGWIVITYIA